MPDPTPPSLLETALGGMLQDIGKFMQRAHGSVRQMDSAVRDRESDILPVFQGRHSHKHALWTEAFFQWMEDRGLSFPGANLWQVRNMAVFHHRPEAFGALGWLAAEADRLASAMDRKPRDEALEDQAEGGRWDRFIRVPLVCPFGPVDLGLGTAPGRVQTLTELLPDDRLLPVEDVDGDQCQARYAELWRGFTAEFESLCKLDHPALFCEGLLSLSERYTWAIPSSTVDLPDISLHDHNRSVAAIAACLHAWHQARGSLLDEAAVRDRGAPKFRFLAGDLSGIQHTLFTLANQQVKGVNKILRARSFLLGMLTEAAALRCRQVLGLPVFNLLQNAGGRFLLLVPALEEVEPVVAGLRRELDAWLQDRYLGELALNLALSAPFAGADLLPPGYHAVRADLDRKLAEAKQRPLASRPGGVLAADYGQGVCGACGVRPAAHREDELPRCRVCHEEQRVGGWLTRVAAAGWREGPPRRGRDDWEVGLFGDLCLELYKDLPGRPAAGLLSGFRLYRGEATPPGPWPLRFVANYVPRLAEGEVYADLDDPDDAARRPGEIKTFEQLARHALEERDGRPMGKPWLAVLKADVDRLGLLFGFGLRDTDSRRDRSTLSRHAALSRMLDLFFTGYLQELLRREFPHTYTVYAGGDDLLLIGPWRQTLELAEVLEDRFRRYVGGNPNISLSAGLALVKANQPLNRSVWEAEERLEAAKDAGRGRVCVLDDEPVTWDDYRQARARSEQLDGWLRRKLVGTGLVYKILYFADQRRRAETGGDLAAAGWRARWGYHLARNVRDNRILKDKEEKRAIMAGFNELLGLDEQIRVSGRPASPRIAVSIALYRNRG